MTGQATTTDLVEEQENPNHKSNDKAKKSTTHQINLKPKVVAPNTSTAVAIPSEKSADLQALGVKVKSMMEKGQKMIPNGKQANGTPRQATSFICKVCGKEGQRPHIRAHIEANHMEGIGIQCDICEKTSSSREGLRFHKRRFHK